ncbi:hypothetical protein MPTK1_6g15640 [Marchantia polymorpha subsp. ruderalis]|uniref:Uncharacterized protein n=2 Tax=Marchantia polymorpha TaxID=3197 RepID=A0AAF6BSF1_MARPO|nr:hypothetical protein MARPO_0056s0076 [Marchantia polymorpha]BBN14935.1 hypothetical protein Mp_6g15640 [Marchantia polymorpha subsp. ruderalis]|eukprot:PTQ37619.1 hypothetical protein MARPO_0056s0076 [Marchantia polymorpha]
MGKSKHDQPLETIDTKSFSPKTGLIDAASIAVYRSIYNTYTAKHGAKSDAEPHMNSKIETRLHTTVDEQKKKRKRDMTSVAMSTAAGTMVPFSGIPIMVATTMVQCVGFSASLGLIPIANVRSLSDAQSLAKQLTATLEKASTSGLKAALEAFILEALKQAGIGYWLWDEILKSTVTEITSGVVTEAAWIMTPLFMAPKYMLHRKLIKKMYASLGEKAIVVHKAWVTDHLILGKPISENEILSDAIPDACPAAAPAAAAPAAAPAPVSHNGFPSAYPGGLPAPNPIGYLATAHSQLQYESNSQPPPQYYNQPGYQAQGQYNQFPSSYSSGQTNSATGHQWYGPPQSLAQQGTYDPNAQAPPPGPYNHDVHLMHTLSEPHMLGSQSHDPAQVALFNGAPNYPQSGYYPQQGQNGQNGYNYQGHQLGHAPSAPPAVASGLSETAQQWQNGQNRPAYNNQPQGGYNPAWNQPSGPGFSQEQAGSSQQPQHQGQSQSAPQSGQQQQFPSQYSYAAQSTQQTMSSYSQPPAGYPGHNQQYSQSAPGPYPSQQGPGPGQMQGGPNDYYRPQQGPGQWQAGSGAPGNYPPQQSHQQRQVDPNAPGDHPPQQGPGQWQAGNGAPPNSHLQQGPEQRQAEPA